MIFTGFWTPLHPVSDPQIQHVALRRAEASWTPVDTLSPSPLPQVKVVSAWWLGDPNFCRLVRAEEGLPAVILAKVVRDGWEMSWWRDTWKAAHGPPKMVTPCGSAWGVMLKSTWWEKWAFVGSLQNVRTHCKSDTDDSLELESTEPTSEVSSSFSS